MVSIIVPARNEAESILSCVRSLLQQDCGNPFEVIVVDDHSDDGTSDILKDHFKSDERLRIFALPDGAEGKKAALAFGIETSAGEYISTVDADCTVRDGWLSSGLQVMQPDINVVTGPVLIDKATHDLEGFQMLDLLALAIVTGGSLHFHIHILGNGANMLFRRSAFEKVGGYKVGNGFASGDDLFLLQEIIQEYGRDSIAYNGSREGVVWTIAEKDFESLSDQRVRWASKNRGLSDSSIQLTWAFLWVVSLAALVSPFLLIFGLLPLKVFTVFISVKAIMEYLVLRMAAKYYGIGSMKKYFITSFLINITYVVMIGIVTGFTSEYKWKDRKVR